MVALKRFWDRVRSGASLPGIVPELLAARADREIESGAATDRSLEQQLEQAFRGAIPRCSARTQGIFEYLVAAYVQNPTRVVTSKEIANQVSGVHGMESVSGAGVRRLIGQLRARLSIYFEKRAVGDVSLQIQIVRERGGYRLRVK